MTALIICFSILAMAFATMAYADSDMENYQSRNKMTHGIQVVWGINGGDKDWKRDDMHLRLAEHAREIGVTNIRTGINWFEIEGEQGNSDWSEVDERINFIHDQGFEIVAVLASTPLWATGLEEEAIQLVKDKYLAFIGVLPCGDEHLDALSKWTEEVVRRYKGKVKHYEVGNEDDGWPAPIIVRDYTGKPVDVRIGGDAAVYVKRLKASYDAIKRADPNARAALTGLSSGGHTMFLQQLYGNGAKGYFDAVAIHPYVDDIAEGADWHWLRMTNELLDQMGDSDKTLWLTEWGYAVDNDNPDSLALHAEVVEQVLLRIETMDRIEVANLHTLNDWRSNEESPNSLQKMGLMTRDLKPKPAFEAFKRVTEGNGELRDTLTILPRPEPKRPPRQVIQECLIARTPPDIDADLSDWEGVASLPLTDSEGNEGGTAHLMRDMDYLYVAIEMRDTHQHQPLGGEMMWLGDSLQIAFDFAPHPRVWPRYDKDCVEFGFCLTSLGLQGIRFHGGAYLPTGIVLPLDGQRSVAELRLKGMAEYKAGVYTYEIAIPWREISLEKALTGRLIGVSIAINSYDEEKKRTVYEFGSGITGEKDPSLFKQVML